MRSKLFVALWPALLLSGCMMAGMHGMGGMGGMGPTAPGGDGPFMATSGPHIVKEVVADGIRVTADFPSFGPSDSLTYTVVLSDLDGRAITSDAIVFLSVTASAFGKVEPVLRGDGRFIFRPSIPRDGPYRLTVLVERVGDTIFDPPLSLDQVVQLSAPIEHSAGSGHAPDRVGLSPLLLFGAGLMAVMMMLSYR